MSHDLGVRPPGRREAVVALAIACLLVGMSWAANRGTDRPAEPPAATGSPAGEPDETLDLDVDTPVTQEQVQACLSRRFASSVDDVTVLYSQTQRAGGTTVPVLVLRNEAGELRVCDAFGADGVSQVPVRYADGAHPVRILSNGDRSLTCEGTRLTGFRESHWLSVAPIVAQAQERFVVDGVAGPWFTTRAQGGLVHLFAWLGKQKAGAEVAVQVRLLDDAGTAVPQQGLPTDAEPLMQCDGASVQIG